ncbi:cytochrome P450 [Micromonospora sp. S-DT3-3-22]|uniref:cytochrome P450 n=1 Tax=Micromonospora sp. S-DT3-3-22 TaxID=2755359 RepID=UPI001E60EA4B|nr:cytochrome P450 [Micromonospora sp. S-DT3-3-22]
MTTVVAAEPVHVDAIAALLEELHTFYGETEVEPRDVQIRQINEALFGDPPLAHAVLVGTRRHSIDTDVSKAQRRDHALRGGQLVVDPGHAGGSLA